jgi:uncharacterized protein (TIGR03437 family)
LASLLLSGPVVAQPTITAVLNGASFDAGVAPGSIISIFGTGLASQTAQAANVPLPTSLGGTSVAIRGNGNVPLYFVSPTQINAVVPFQISVLALASAKSFSLAAPPTVTVTTSAGTSKPYALEVRQAVPGLFTASGDGKGQALIFNPDFSVATQLLSGHTYIAYAAGLGAVSPVPPLGYGGFFVEPLNRVSAPTKIVVGEQEITPDFAGIAPLLVNVYQINFTLPSDFVPATDRIFVRGQGWQSNVASFPVPSSNLVAQGTAQALYPYTLQAGGTMPTLTFGLLLEVGEYTLQVNLPGSNQPVRIAAVTDAGSTVVRLDENGGTWNCQATQTAPAISARSLNFWYLWPTTLLLDFIQYTQQTVGSASFSFPTLAFPDDVVPATRVDPVWMNVVTQIPAVNSLSSPLLNGSMQSACTVANGVFTVNGTTNLPISRFGGFRMLPYAPFPTRTSTFKLYVNGQVIAQDQVTYPVTPLVLAN